MAALINPLPALGVSLEIRPVQDPSQRGVTTEGVRGCESERDPPGARRMFLSSLLCIIVVLSLFYIIIALPYCLLLSLIVLQYEVEVE